MLAYQRLQAEGGELRATLVIDEESLLEQAEFMGLEPQELAERYRNAGLNGIALYEETFESAARKGRIAMLTGNEARAVALSLGEELPEVQGRSTLVSEIEAGALETALIKNGPAAQEVTLGGRTWYRYPGEGKERPMGPDRDWLEQWVDDGWDIAYRPKNFANLQQVGPEFPEEANYLIHMGTEVAGNPNALEQTISYSQDFLTGVIDMVEQDGIPDISGEVPIVRVFSINQDWLNTLEPGEAAEKYVLAANERNVRVMYIRPYTKGTMGDMLANTEALITSVRNGLERSGFTIGPVELLEIDYEPNPALRTASAVGIAAGLVLLGLMYPGSWGVFMAAAVLGLGILAGRGLNWDAFALVAALAFPVIGFGHLPEKFQNFFMATLVSLAGAVLLVAVGSDRASMMGITPFAGVAATLIVPPVLFLAHYMIRFRPPARWISELWNYPIQVGHVALGMIGVAALGLVFLRRGNFPIIGVSSVEIAIRDALSALFARPRFKELIGHPLAVLALGNRAWPGWIKGPLLTGGVIAQASIINSFSHYHTPLMVSLERTLVALALGLVIGLIALPLVKLATGGIGRWLERARREPEPVKA